MKSQKTMPDKPTLKCRVRNQFPLHLVRGRRTDIYEHNDIVWLTDAEARKYQHLIEIENA